MNENRKVIIDAGHGGPESWEPYIAGRKEKNDTLRLAFDLGSALSAGGIQVSYTRCGGCIRITSYEKAETIYADLKPIHMNAMPVPWELARGRKFFGVFRHSRTAGKNIGRQLAAGADRSGCQGETRLRVLRRSKCRRCWWKPDFWTMKKDNAFFDANYGHSRDAIAVTASLRP